MSEKTNINNLISLDESGYKYDQLMYPLDLDSGEYGQNAIVFYVNEDKKSTFRTRVGDDNLSQRVDVRVNRTRRTKGAIAMYMPGPLEFNYGAEWENVDLGSVGMARSAGMRMYRQIANGGIESIADNLRNGDGAFSGELTNMLRGQLRAAGLGLAETLGLEIRSAIESETRATTNPYREVVFKGINNRQFSFEFVFTPRNPKESLIVNNILKMFKFHSHPEIQSDTGGRFITYPSDFDIEFLFGGRENPWLPKIGRCVLNSMTERHFPSRVSQFTDGASTEISMTLQFTEMDMNTKSKIAEGR